MPPPIEDPTIDEDDSDDVEEEEDSKGGNVAAAAAGRVRSWQRQQHYWHTLGPVASPPWCSARFGSRTGVTKSSAGRLIRLHLQSCTAPACITCFTYVSSHECIVCRESMQGCELHNVWLCRACSRPLHLRCAAQWAKTQRAAGLAASCAYCRAPAAARPGRARPEKSCVQLDAAIVKVIGHHVYGGARQGSLHNI